MGDEATFLFADLAGFTALTEAHGDERAADIATHFCAELNRRLPDDAEDLKMLGDACLVRVSAADDAVALALRLTGELAPTHNFPGVRVGMHTGGAVRRGAEWFGATLNIAARVSELAGSGDVLLTGTTREAAGRPEGVVFEDCGTHELRHVSALAHLYRARDPRTATPDARWIVDPVCHMRLDAERSATKLLHNGIEVFFCSALCAGKFSRSPERYLRDAPRMRH